MKVNISEDETMNYPEDFYTESMEITIDDLRESDKTVVKQ